LSTLTKILVVLVVVLSLLQTAATVVFVNRVENAGRTVADLEDTKKVNAAQITTLQAALAEAQAQVGTVRQQAQAQVAASQAELLKAQQLVADQGVKLAQVTSQSSQQSVDLARLSEALKASEDTKAKQADMVTELRKFNDELTKRVADLNGSNADLTNRLEVTERERRFLQEQNAELQNQNTRSAAAMKDAGVTPPAAGQPTGLRAGAPDIKATVSDVKTIANIPYATITVGAADRVVKGMQFTVVDGSGNFLGFLTVDTVEPNEAVGRLSGPRVPDIKAGNDARTRL
jgi:hypothetical protein